MRVVNVGLLGLGTVGQAVVQLNRDFNHVRFEMQRALVKNPRRPRQVGIPLTTDPADILDDPAIDVVVEVTGGREPARQWILQALQNGKAVVTANKEVLAYHGPQLLAASREWDTYLGFEASVGGGIPILDALKYHLTAAPIEDVFGVVNGTTNYLINAMAGGEPLGDALRRAQRLGFAEADPGADIEGHDAVRKTVILAYLAYGQWLHPDEVPVKGLDDWPPQLFARLNQAGFALRLLAWVRQSSQGAIQAQVQPTIVPVHHWAARLQAAQNGVGARTKAGLFWMEGPGAGGLPTATSIWADIRRSLTVRHPIMMDDAPIVSGGIERIPTPYLAIAQDPDRRLTAHHFQPLSDPSMALLDGPLADAEGLFQFPFWKD